MTRTLHNWSDTVMSEKAQKWHRLSRKLILDETVPQAWHDDARAAFVRGDAAEFTQLAKYGTLAVVVDNDEPSHRRNDAGIALPKPPNIMREPTGVAVRESICT